MNVDDSCHLQKLLEPKQPYVSQKEKETKENEEKNNVKKIEKLTTNSQEQELITKASMLALSEVSYIRHSSPLG